MPSRKIRDIIKNTIYFVSLITGWLEKAGYEIWAMTPRADAEPLHDISPARRTAILLGAEGPGLDPALIKRCRPVRIEMAGSFDSLNVATAGAVALSHLHARRQRP